MDKDYFEIGSRLNGKVRWYLKFVKLSRFFEIDELAHQVNVKVARIDKRRGPLSDDAISQIVENLAVAKIARTHLARKLKTYQPKPQPDSPSIPLRNQLESQGTSFDTVACSIFKEKHYRMRSNPAILFPGFVPDGNEAFYLLRKVFLKYGSAYYVNYPGKHFHKEAVYHQIFDMVRDINNRKIKNVGKKGMPFLIGTSFGCSVIVNFMRWLHETELIHHVDIRGLVLISPVLCLDDVVDTTSKRQKTLVGRAISHLTEVDQNDPEAVAKAMQKARSIFQKMFTSGRDLLNFTSKDLIPVFAIEDEVLAIFNQDHDSSSGYFHRYLDLKDLTPPQPGYLSNLPTLVLFAEGEADVLAPSSPTFTTFSDIGQLSSIFPNGQVEFVYSKDSNRRVTHSDLIFQADRFTEHLDPWLERLTV
ncbi:hypothetical protein SCOR_06355 [Sulfidibacter corallicola]|uniref:Alpha/beta hydrolase n=1 Tax=Sulfidibacter corallicola TaxID=2818388 RepID=A0A8A4TRI7_SULCO|nr:hypothetical protein [Sulfidibacter corallicola]QTD51611.1 hypothetical protein J3U87_04000 [Sulfidibacter corallicola]